MVISVSFLHHFFCVRDRHLLEVVAWFSLSLHRLRALRYLLLLFYLESWHQRHPSVGPAYRVDILSRLVVAKATRQSLDGETILMVNCVDAKVASVKF
jgi:hypothetical protein